MGRALAASAAVHAGVAALVLAISLPASPREGPLDVLISFRPSPPMIPPPPSQEIVRPRISSTPVELESVPIPEAIRAVAPETAEPVAVERVVEPPPEEPFRIDPAARIDIERLAPLSESPPSSTDPEPLPDGNLKPVYPLIARRQGWEGRVVIRAWVGPDGRCESAVIHVSSGHGALDEAAREAVLTWKFRPASRGGIPCKATLDIPFEFRLTGG